MLWDEYLKQEEMNSKFCPPREAAESSVRLEYHNIRVLRHAALEGFITSLEETPIERWADWALFLCQRVIDDGDPIPIPLHLYQRILFPVLYAGYI